MGTQRAVLVANRGFGLVGSRRLLMRRLQSKGWEVIAATADDNYSLELTGEGIGREVVHFVRAAFSPMADVLALRALRRIYSRYRPQLVHHFNAKPVILGTVAARLARDRGPLVVNTITGLGNAFASGGLTRRLAGLGYRIALRHADATIFQNRDDQRLFLEKKWVQATRAELIVGSGVDLERFRPPERDNFESPRILMAGRLLWQKGVREFMGAATHVRALLPRVRFQLAGEFDEKHPDAIGRTELRNALATTPIEFLGYIENMEQVLPEIYAFVLPSYYREGVPRVVLEAAACGVPSIGADVPGIREVIAEGETGFLVPPRDGTVLGERLMQLLSDVEIRNRMGRAARRRAEARFDVDVITDRQLAVYRSLGLGNV